MKKIIACLDMKDGRVVKGVNFVDFQDVSDPAEAAKLYSEEGADEIVLLDIYATNENRQTMLDVVKKTAEKCSVPFTVGGGIKSISDIESILSSGADKISINSAAVKNPELINEASKKFGKEKIVIAIDAKKYDEKYCVHIGGGLEKTDIDAIEWAKEAQKRGAGAILVTSVDADGTKAGYDLDLTKQIVDAVSIPVIASGGAGSLEDFYDVFEKAGVDAALAASLFHFRIIGVQELKAYLKEKGIAVS